MKLKPKLTSKLTVFIRRAYGMQIPVAKVTMESPRETFTNFTNNRYPLERFEREFRECVDRNDMAGCVDIYNATIEHEFRPGLNFISSLLDFCIRNALLDAGESVWTSMSYLDLQPQLSNYVQRIRLYNVTQQLEKAMKVFREIQDKGFELNSLAFHALLEAFSPNADLASLCDFFDALVSGGLVPTEETFAVLMRASISKRDVSEAVGWYRAMENKSDIAIKSSFDSIIPTSLTNELLIKATSYSKNPMLAFGFLTAFSPSTRTVAMYETLMKRYGLHATPQMCGLLMDDMEKIFKPTPLMFSYYAVCCFRNHNGQKAYSLIEQMKQNGYAVGNAVLQSQQRYLFKSGEFEKALIEFETLVHGGQQISEAMIIDMGCLLSEKLKLKRLKQTEFHLDLLQGDNQLLKIWELYQPFRGKKYTRPVRLYRALLEYFLTSKNLKMAQTVFEAIIHDNGPPTFELAYEYSKLLLKYETLDFVLDTLEYFMSKNEKRLIPKIEPTPKLRTVQTHAILDKSQFVTIKARSWMNRNEENTKQVQENLLQVFTALIHEDLLRSGSQTLDRIPSVVVSNLHVSEVLPNANITVEKRKIKSIKANGQKRFNTNYMNVEQFSKLQNLMKAEGVGKFNERHFKRMEQLLTHLQKEPTA